MYIRCFFNRSLVFTKCISAGYYRSLFLYIFLFGSLTTGLHAQQDTALTLNEIMFYPASGNNEYIEIFNLSYTQSFDLSTYRIKYETSNPDSLRPLLRGSLLLPRSYAVIFEGDYDTLTGIYRTLIPPNALIMRIADNSFGTTGMANTADRKIYLINAQNDTIDTYTYSANNSQTRSDEKILQNRDNSAANWGNASINNGTPGFRNSISLFQFDLAVKSFTLSPKPVIVNNQLDLHLSVLNKGLAAAENFTLFFYDDRNYDSIPQPEEIILSNGYTGLLPGDSVVLMHSRQVLSSNYLNFIAVISYQDDEFLFNNTAVSGTQPVIAQHSFNEVIINEIQYAPAAPEKEWIELYNRGSNPVNLKNWKIADRVSQINLTPLDLLLQPGNFLVISPDSSLLNIYPYQFYLAAAPLPSLNNDGDGLYLKDSLEILIDSLTYLPAWGGAQGKSLERVYYDSASHLQNNWRTSAGLYKGTPGLKNSAAPKNQDIVMTSVAAQSQFTILPNPIKVNLAIANKGIQPVQSYTLRIYIDTNRDSIASDTELIILSGGSVLNPGDSLYQTVSISVDSTGFYYFIFSLSLPGDEDTLNNKRYLAHRVTAPYTSQSDIIINEIMYAPASGMQEWVEIYNRSNRMIPASSIGIADRNDTVRLRTDYMIQPGAYVVISKDSSVLTAAGYTFPLITAQLPALNNDGDRVLLIDSLGALLDSIIYPNNTQITGGISLERRSPDVSSSDSTNWSPAKPKVRSTPGRKNSVTIKDIDIELTSAVTIPAYPVKGDTVSISLLLTNRGLLPASGNIYIYADTNHDSIPDFLFRELLFPPLAPAATNTFRFDAVSLSLTAPLSFFISIQCTGDEDTSDNYQWMYIYPGTPPGTIVVNEIMYNPANGEPEWVELFNTGNDTISLSGWKISDVLTTPAVHSIPAEARVLPKDYLVLSKDAAIGQYHRYIPSPWLVAPLPVLNNDRDGVILYEERGRIMDSVFYTGGTKGISIERRDAYVASVLPSNWAFSTDVEQSTPGRINSATPRVFDIAVSGISSSPRAPVPGDSLSVSVILINLGSTAPDTLTVFIKLRDIASHLQHTRIVTIDPDADTISVLFDNAILLASSPVTIEVQIFSQDEDTYNNYFETFIHSASGEKTILITEIMYNPLTGYPEWIELYNTSDKAVQLKNWQIGDYLPSLSKQAIARDFTFAPNSYVVISSDSTLFTLHGLTPQNAIISPVPSLSNTGDGVFLYDPNGYIVDSAVYTSGSTSIKGRTLERVTKTGYSNDPQNWMQSPEPGGSPAVQNKSSLLLPGEFAQLVINEIMFAPSTGGTEYIEFYNAGTTPAPLFFYNLTNQSGIQLTPDAYILQPDAYFVVADDSSIYSDYPGLLFSGNVYISPGLTLKNDIDSISLRLYNDNKIDAVHYSKDWHNKNLRTTAGIALEKINPHLSSNDPRSWSSSVNPRGGTPGSSNSILTELNQSEKEISFNPNPFSPDDDGFEDFTIIRYNTPFTYASLIVTIFDRFGRRVRKLVDGEVVNGKGELVYDGRDDSGTPLKIGIYIFLAEFSDKESGTTKSIKAAFVIARRL